MLRYVLVCAALTASSSAAAFSYSEGPITCWSELASSVAFDTRSGVRFSVTMPDGTVREFKVSYRHRAIPPRHMPNPTTFSFGPKDAITCAIDTNTVTGYSCTDRPIRNGWAARCDYCARAGSEIECKRVEGSVIEITARDAVVN